MQKVRHSPRGGGGLGKKVTKYDKCDKGEGVNQSYSLFIVRQMMSRPALHRHRQSRNHLLNSLRETLIKGGKHRIDVWSIEFP